jgi:hypothetical protein
VAAKPLEESPFTDDSAKSLRDFIERELQFVDREVNPSSEFIRSLDTDDVDGGCLLADQKCIRRSATRVLL